MVLEEVGFGTARLPRYGEVVGARGVHGEGLGGKVPVAVVAYGNDALLAAVLGVGGGDSVGAGISGWRMVLVFGLR